MMSSDADYVAFLKKSQTDYSGPSPPPPPPPPPPATSATTTGVHPAVTALLGQRFYVSDADEPFEGVSIPWEKEMFPDEDEFRELAGVSSGQAVRRLTPAQWDPRGEYTDVVDAVAAASGEEGNKDRVRVYRVPRAGCRAEYFVVGIDRGAATLVGVKTLAVES